MNIFLKKVKNNFQKNSPIYFELFFDVVAIFISFVIHYHLIFNSGLFIQDLKPSFLDFLLAGILLVFYWLFIFFIAGMYRDWFLRSPFDEFTAVIKTTFVGCFILFFFVFLDSSSRPRLLFLLYFINLSFFLLLGRFFAKRLQLHFRQKKIVSIPVLILGTIDEVADLFKKIRTSPSWGYDVKGVILIDQNNTEPKVENYLPKGKIYDFLEFEKAIMQEKPFELFIAIHNPNHELILQVANKCAELGILVKIVPDLYDVLVGTVKAFPLFSIPLIEISTQLLRPWEAFLKRVLDITISVLILVLGIPLWIIIAILIKLDSKGPVFFKQERIGKGGKVFHCYKFRSMYVGSDKVGPLHTKINDPRVTKVGYFLRRTHLDEIPQLWNVLKGEMSLVGPRPLNLEIDKLKENPLVKRRFVVRPGITGWNQVNKPIYEPNDEYLINKLKDDLYYIGNMSIKLDLEILLRTIYLVLRGRGQA
ncbi:MAG: sugar transferase [Candidatus Kapaibacteriales bacterium]